MRNKCLLLLKVLLLGQFKRKGKSNRNIGSTLMIISFGVLGLLMAVYSFMLSYGVGVLGMSYVVPSYAVALTGLITLFFTALKTNGVLFAYRDYDILMSLPVKTSTVIASRFLTMYVMNVAFTVLVMLPMGIGYVIFVKPGFLFYPLWILGMLLAPLIPTTLATVLGAIIILFTSRFRHANALTTIISIALICVVMVGSFSMGGMGNNPELATVQMENIGQMMLQQINRIYPPAVLFDQAINSFNMMSFAIFAAGSIVWYFLFVKVVAIKYKSMNTGLMTSHTRSDYKMTKLQANSPLMALCKKEAKRFFSCPIYTLNMGMGAVLTLLLAVGLAVMGAEKLETMLNFPGMASVLTQISPFLIAMLLCMTCTSSVSLSLEGKNLWILKSLPLDKKTVYQSKILFNLMLTIPAGLIASALIAIRVSMTPLMLLAVFTVPVTYSAFMSVLGMYINIKMPNYQWTTETAVVKQSLSSMAGMFGGMINGLIPLLVMIALTGWIAEVATLIFMFTEGVLAFFLYRHVITLDF